MTNLVFNGEDLGDFAGLPEASQKAILSRVAGHFNNEAASARISWAKKQVGDGADTQAARAYTDSHPDEARAFVDSWFAAKRQAILDGTLGVRVGGSSVDPFESTVYRIAKREIAAALPKIGQKLPTTKADGTNTVCTFKGVEYVGTEGADAIIALWLEGEDKSGLYGKKGEANRPRIERAATRELKAKADAAQAKVDGGDLM